MPTFKKQIYIFLIIGFNFGWSQFINAQEIEIFYNAQAMRQQSDNMNRNKMLSNLSKMANRGLKNIQIISRKHHNWYDVTYIENLSMDDFSENATKFAVSVALSGNRIVVDQKTKRGYYESSLTNMVKEVKIDNVQWEITDETKVIIGYRCYKAIAKILDPDQENRLTTPIVAWFCPDLPYQIGPSAYAELPGAILALKNSKVSFMATALKKNIETTPLQRPLYEPEQLLSHKEFENYLKENNPIAKFRN